jgi:hypothetical protein
MARLVLLLLLVPAPALAQSWADSFPPAAAGSWISVPDSGVIVVPAGAPTADLTAATAALSAALRTSGRAKLVMDAAALGDVSALDDAAIVKRTGHLPVDEVIVVRVFAGAAATAVVSHYGKDGGSRGGYSAVAGLAIAARTGSGAGVGESAARALAQASAETAKPPAEGSYDDLYVDFVDVITVTTNKYGSSVSTGIQPVQGKYKKPLPGATFYDTVERPDLAASYRRTIGWKWGLGISGALVGLGGLTYMVYGITDSVGVCSRSQLGAALGGDGSGCHQDSTTPLIVGGSAATAGFIALLVGVYLDPHPVDAPGARRIADEYNQRLRARTERPQVQPGLFAAAGGGGLEVHGRF